MCWMLNTETKIYVIFALLWSVSLATERGVFYGYKNNKEVKKVIFMNELRLQCCKICKSVVGYLGHLPSFELWIRRGIYSRL